jgi:hypothetical protein
MWSEQAARNSIALIAVTALAFAAAFAIGAVTRSSSSPPAATSLAPAVSVPVPQASVSPLAGGPAIPVLKTPPKPPAPHPTPASTPAAPVSSAVAPSTVSQATAPPSNPGPRISPPAVVHNTVGGSSPPSNGNTGSRVAHGSF